MIDATLTKNADVASCLLQADCEENVENYIDHASKEGKDSIVDSSNEQASS